MDSSEILLKYSDCMEEIKKRIEVLDSLVDQKISTPYLIINVELACIQLRKILELIAFSSVVANKKEFQTVQSKLEKLWNAKQIIDKVELINPKYYPEAIKIQCFDGDPNITRTLPVKSGFLTRDEFLDIYARCGGILHAQNPFSNKKNFVQVQSFIPKWVSKIKILLDKHVVTLSGEDVMVMVIMNFGYKEKVSIGIYGKQDY